MNINDLTVPPLHPGPPPDPESLPVLADRGGRAFLRDARDDRLPQLALAALLAGDPFRAFALSDRWCRESRPHVASLLLRAEASHRLGHADYALDDLRRALELEPGHRALNSRILEWGTGEERLRAAESLANVDRGSRMRSLPILAAAGARGVGELLIQDEGISGWIAWKTGCSASLRLRTAGTTDEPLIGDPAHPLSGIFGHAAEIAAPPPEAGLTRASLFVDGDEIFCASARRSGGEPRKSEPPLDCSAHTVTIIVPVYGDADSTRICLESARAAVENTPDAQVLAIDDASPSAEIRDYLARYAAPPKRHVRTNEENLGFVGAVNRALAMTPAGDVILLNSDTIAPPDLIRALQAIASEDPTIGTINPLSNNGEFVSFPAPFRSNPLDEQTWDILHMCAGLANPGAAVDIPSGTGFCLYVTRACLDAVGALSADFGRGYLEDADIGLRARQAGFRNVCAPSIYVAHRGSRSFAGKKAMLVARNRKTLARKFPEYEDECRAYVELDPLAKARAAIEELWVTDDSRRLLVGPHRMAPALRERARQLAEQGLAPLLVTIRRAGSRWDAVFRGWGEAAPRSLEIRLDGGSWQNSKFSSLLRKWSFDRIEVSGLSELPDFAMEDIFSLSPSVDLLLVDASPKQDAGAPGPHRQVCAAPQDPRPCVDCRRRRVKDASLDALERWARARTRCAATLALDELSKKHWQGLYPGVSIDAHRRKPKARASAAGNGNAADRIALGVLLPVDTPATLGLLMALADRLGGDSCDIFVFGKTSLDARLIARGVFVVGYVAPVEIARVAAQYRIGRYLLPYRLENYWVLESFRRAAPAPAAFFDWSFGEFRAAARDLVLDPSVCDEKAAFAIGAWMNGHFGAAS
jgi:GT2 family glycosyltransferase